LIASRRRLSVVPAWRCRTVRRDPAAHLTTDIARPLTVSDHQTLTLDAACTAGPSWQAHTAPHLTSHPDTIQRVSRRVRTSAVNITASSARSHPCEVHDGPVGAPLCRPAHEDGAERPADHRSSRLSAWCSMAISSSIPARSRVLRCACGRRCRIDVTRPTVRRPHGGTEAHTAGRPRRPCRPRSGHQPRSRSV
jgi:hypothetical protein